MNITTTKNGMQLDFKDAYQYSQTMYKNILLAWHGRTTDPAIVGQVKSLVNSMQGHVTLLYIDSPAALADCEYIDHLRQIIGEFRSAGISAQLKLTYGDLVEEIEKQAPLQDCDLIAIVTHKHRSLVDFIFGSEVSRIQDRIKLPVLFFRKEKQSCVTPVFAAGQLPLRRWKQRCLAWCRWPFCALRRFASFSNGSATGKTVNAITSSWA